MKTLKVWSLNDREKSTSAVAEQVSMLEWPWQNSHLDYRVTYLRAETISEAVSALAWIIFSKRFTWASTFPGWTAPERNNGDVNPRMRSRSTGLLSKYGIVWQKKFNALLWGNRHGYFHFQLHVLLSFLFFIDISVPGWFLRDSGLFSFVHFKTSQAFQLPFSILSSPKNVFQWPFSKVKLLDFFLGFQKIAPLMMVC